MRRLCRVDWIDWVFIQWLGLGRNGGQSHTEHNFFFFWEESEKRLWAQKIECVNCAVRAPGWVSLRIGVMYLCMCLLLVCWLCLFRAHIHLFNEEEEKKRYNKKPYGKWAHELRKPPLGNQITYIQKMPQKIHHIEQIHNAYLIIDMFETFLD